jgi:PAS domain S-box-containing protein
MNQEANAGAGVRAEGGAASALRALTQRYEGQARVFDRLLSSITDFAYTFDLTGRFTFINKALLDLWGMGLEEAVGKNFFDLPYPQELAAKLQRQIQQVIETKQRVVDETRYTNPAGSTGYYQYIFSPSARTGRWRRWRARRGTSPSGNSWRWSTTGWHGWWRRSVRRWRRFSGRRRRSSASCAGRGMCLKW